MENLKEIQVNFLKRQNELRNMIYCSDTLNTMDLLKHPNATSVHGTKPIAGDYDAIMYEVFTWGQKYYISEKEIRDYIGIHSSLFTNVLYIEEK